MARWKLTPRKSVTVVETPEQWATRFRHFNRDLRVTLGEFLAQYFAMWEKAKDYVTNFEASQELIDHVPSDWRLWVTAQRDDLIFLDPVTRASRCHFPKLISRIFNRWIVYHGPPKTPAASSGLLPLESSHRDSSNEHFASLLRARNAASSCKDGEGSDHATSTRFVLHRGITSDGEAVRRSIREKKLKRTVDMCGSESRPREDDEESAPSSK